MHLALAEIPSFSHDHFRVRLKLRSAVYSGWRQECAATFDIMVVTKMFNAHVLFGSVTKVTQAHMENGPGRAASLVRMRAPDL